eukprot:4229708-Pleurochrysis_carterae.AAC.1
MTSLVRLHVSKTQRAEWAAQAAACFVLASRHEDRLGVVNLCACRQHTSMSREMGPPGEQASSIYRPSPF